MTAKPVSWTLADQAELDVLVHELVSRVFAHRERCSECAPGSACPQARTAVAAAVDVIVAWRDGRRLRTRAEHLRAGQELIDLRRRLSLAA